MLIQAARKYENMFLKQNTSVAVMIRLQHFFISLGGIRNITMLSQATIVQSYCHYQEAESKVSTRKDICDCRCW